MGLRKESIKIAKSKLGLLGIDLDKVLLPVSGAKKGLTKPTNRKNISQRIF